jgi:PhnB protein
MHLNPYLLFNGQCEAAFRFYEKCLGGKIEMLMTHRQSPMADQVSSDWLDKIIHVRLNVGNTLLLNVGNTLLMGSDAPPERYEGSKGFSVSLIVDSPAEAESTFHALAENGTVQMPLQQTFWAERFGMLIDQFGISWMINCERAA